MTAQAAYNELETDRSFYTDRAEENAAYSIPSLFPRVGHARGTRFIAPQQGIAAQGVNHLAAKLLTVMLPPTGNFFRFIPDREARELLEQEGPEFKQEVEESLGRMERDVQLEVESQAVRVTAIEALKHLIVAGNVLTYQPDSGGIVMYPLRQFVVQRDREDNLLCIVIRESVAPSALPEDFRSEIEVDEGTHKTVDIYTKVYRTGKDTFESFQEVGGKRVPGTEGRYKEDELPWQAIRWTKVDGDAYGRSLCEEYISTIRNAESLTKSIVEFAKAAARVTPLIRPASVTSVADINSAENGEAVYGNEEDISFMQVNKFPDFRTAESVLQSQVKALQAVFLMNMSATRDAERVTAEEVRLLAAELETSLGGVFSILARDFQLPLIKGLVRQMHKRGALPKFAPALKGHIMPTVLTGVDALGRQADLERFAQATQLLINTVGPEALAAVANVRAIVDFVFTNASVDTTGLLKSEEQIQQEQQAAQQAQMAQQAMQSGLGPAINQLGAGGAAQAVENAGEAAEEEA